MSTIPPTAAPIAIPTMAPVLKPVQDETSMVTVSEELPYWGETEQAELVEVTDAKAPLTEL